MPVASTYQSAIQLLIGQSATNQAVLFEVNTDGSIRTQNWREKLGNLGARLNRRNELSNIC